MLADKYMSDTTGVYSMSDVVHLYETSPEKDFVHLEMLFNAYIANGNASKADSVNSILKALVNDTHYALLNDLAIAALSSDYFTLLLSDTSLVEQLEMITELNDYRYSYRAKSLLSGYLGFMFEPNNDLVGGVKTMVYPKYTYDGSVFETVSIFPNPAQDHFFIVFDENADVSQNREVKVYDLSGVLQFTREMKANDYVLEIKTENMAKGMYLVTISANGKEISTQKVAVR